MVLIESDWNLKFAIFSRQDILQLVLIESDWNLKLKVTSITVDQGVLVLIESDWNLKEVKSQISR